VSVLATANQPTLEDFGHDVWWIVLIKVVGIFVVLVVMTLFAIVFERKVVARMQQRIGPNRVGPRGYLQSLADGLKLAFKEDIMPALADKPVYFLAPIISASETNVPSRVGRYPRLIGLNRPVRVTCRPIATRRAPALSIFRELASERSKLGAATMTEVALSRPCTTRLRIALLTAGEMP